jgi:flagella basal body P-ring formation protein FlgA
MMTKISKILLLISFFSIFTIKISAQSTFSSERIENAIIAFLKSQTTDDIEIQIVQNIKPISFAENSIKANLRHNFSDFKGLGFVWIDFYKDEKLITTEQIRVKISKYLTLPIAQRVIRIGEILNPNDIAYKRLDISNYNENELAKDNSIIGKVVRNGIPKNSPIKLQDLSSQILIKKGQVVTIIAQSGAVVIKTLGTALQDGGEGDIVRVKRNNQSNVVLVGTVSSNGEVLITNSQSTVLR